MSTPTATHLIEKIKSYNPNCNEDKILQAFKLAKSAHESQKRNEMQKTQNKMTESHLK